jgi:hypothetical protein
LIHVYFQGYCKEKIKRPIAWTATTIDIVSDPRLVGLSLSFAFAFFLSLSSILDFERGVSYIGIAY